MTDSFKDRLKELSRRLDLIHGQFRKFFGVKTKVKERFTVKMFKTKEEFKTYADEQGVPSIAKAYFSSGTKELVLYDLFNDGMGQSPYGVILHEAAHQFIFHLFGADVPIWFNEAVAQYFESAEFTSSNKVKVGRKVYDRERTLKTYIQKNDTLPLSEMFEMTKDEFYSGKVSLHYATAYCFLYYLLNCDMSTKRLLSRYVTTLKKKSSKEAFEASFAKVNMAQLQKSFDNFVANWKK
jgi:hypothetical protein